MTAVGAEREVAKEEQFLVDSCYSNSDAHDGRERENSIYKEQKLAVNICLCVRGSVSERRFSLPTVCEACAARM